MALSHDPTIDDGIVDPLTTEVERQADLLETEHGWQDRPALNGALDNVLDDRGYHVDGADEIPRDVVERAIRSQLSLADRALLGFSRGACRFEPATPTEAP